MGKAFKFALYALGAAITLTACGPDNSTKSNCPSGQSELGFSLGASPQDAPLRYVPDFNEGCKTEPEPQCTDNLIDVEACKAAKGNNN